MSTWKERLNNIYIISEDQSRSILEGKKSKISADFILFENIIKNKKKKNAESKLRNIVREEIGRNYHTIDTDPYSWKDNPNIEITLYPNSHSNEYTAKVECLSNPELSTEERRFPDETSADFWARKRADEITRALMNS